MQTYLYRYIYNSTPDYVPGHSAPVVPAGLVPNANAHTAARTTDIVVVDFHEVIPAGRVPGANIHIVLSVLDVVAEDTHSVIPTCIVARPHTDVGTVTPTPHSIPVDLHDVVSACSVAYANIGIHVGIEDAVLVYTGAVVTAGIVACTQASSATSSNDIIVGDVHFKVSACLVVHSYLDIP